MDDTKKKIKIKVKKKKINLKKILVLLLGLYLLYFLVSSILKMPIKNIYVTGNNYLSDKEVLELAGIKDYPSYFLTTKRKMTKELLKNKYIKEVKIEKKFFWKVYLNISEYKVLALDKVTGKIILENGKKEENTYNIRDIPILLNEIDEKEYTKFIKAFSKVDSDILNQISEIEYAPSNVDNKRFILYMNDTNYVYISLDKIDKLNEYNKIKNDLEGKTGILYLDSGNYFEIRK